MTKATSAVFTLSTWGRRSPFTFQTVADRTNLVQRPGPRARPRVQRVATDRPACPSRRRAPTGTRRGGAARGLRVRRAAAEEQVLPPDEADPRPDHVPLDDGTGLTDSRGVEPGLLGQLPLGGLEGRLPGLDATAGRLPDVVAVRGMRPAGPRDPA